MKIKIKKEREELRILLITALADFCSKAQISHTKDLSHITERHLEKIWKWHTKSLEPMPIADEALSQKEEEVRMEAKIQGAEDLFRMIDAKYESFKISEAVGKQLTKYRKSLTKTK